MKLWLLVACCVCAAAGTEEKLPALAKQYFTNSVKELLDSFRMRSRAMQKPGLAGLLKEESDRTWAGGISCMREYFRLGHALSANLGFGANAVMVSSTAATQRSGSAYLEHYNRSLSESVTRLERTQNGLRDAYEHFKTKRSHPDKILFVQELAEKNREVLHSMKIKSNILAGFHTDGVAAHLFDESL